MSETFNTDPVRFLKNGRINIGGKIYYGVVNGDPVNVSGDRIDIFANRALTTALPNPISTGSDGRTAVNGVPAKVWLGVRHSLFELDNKNVEQFQDLDRGETPGTGAPIKLTNVQGTNAITAEAPGGITGYVDGQIYIFGKADGANTAITAPWVTLAITGASQGAKPIKFNFNEEIKQGMFQDTQEIQVMYNSAGFPTTDHFTWVNSGRGISILTNIGGTADAITADGGPSKVAYVDGQHYQFKPTANNTGAATLNIETIGAKSIKSQGAQLGANVLKANTSYIVSYNSTGDLFELLNGAIFSNEIFVQFSNLITSTLIIPQDGTSPQITEGEELMSQAFTPQFADSKIEIEVKVQGGIAQLGGSGNNIAWSIALFRVGVASALMADAFKISLTSTIFGEHSGVLIFSFREDAASTTERTYKVRGGQVGTENFRFGGVFGTLPHSSLKIKEIRA